MTAPTRMPTARDRRPLPEGAVAWSRVYVDRNGLPVETPFSAPVDVNGRRTEHIRVACWKPIAVDGKPGQCARDSWIMPGDPVQHCPDHGTLLSAREAPKEPRLPWSAMWQAVEAPARPVWVLAAEAAIGIGMHAADVSPVWALAGSGLVTAGAYAGTRWYLTRRALRLGHLHPGQKGGRRVDTINRRARVMLYAGTLATGWLTAATSLDLSTALGRLVWASLPVAWALSAAPWWRYLEADRNRPAPVEVELVDDAPADDADMVAAAEAAETWAEHVAFKGTRLDPTTWQRTVAGWQAVITSKRGALVSLTDTDRLKSTIAKIAAGYGVKRAAITWIPEHEDDPNQALLLIQPHNPLSDGEIWGGPKTIDMEAGIAENGRLIDGTPMTKRLYVYGWGAPSGIAIGTTGGGKSMHARRDLVIERWASYPDPTTGGRKGAFISILHDPKRLESYAEFRRAVHAYGVTPEDAHRIVDALLRECYRRYDTMGARPWTDRKGRERDGGPAWDPRIHGPIISAYFDEFHIMAKDKEFVAKLEELARMQRACGMRVELMTHMATIGDTGSQALRDLLAGGRATLFRTTSGLNSALATGGTLTGDPRGLPKDPGMCFVSDGETPTMVGRESWIPSDDAQHEHTLYDWLFDEHNQPIGYPAVIPPETLEAFGAEFMRWAVDGHKPGGRELPASTPIAVRRQEDLKAVETLRQILFQAGRPLGRMEIAEHRLWRFGVTSTLTQVLRAGQDAKPPWLVKLPKGKGVYDLTPAAREELDAATAEEREDQAA